MPLNRGQSQTTRWYQLCFVPTSSDSSDDSDVESVVISPSTPTTTSSTWQELFPPPPPPPPPPPNPEPQIDWRFPPPPPPLPDFVRPLRLQQQHQHQPELSGAWAIFDLEVQQDRPQSHSISHVFEGDKSGCSTIAMNGLSRVRVSEIDKLFRCPICMDEFKVCDQAYRLPCTHTYCSECILRWLNSSKTCPVCRLQLSGYSFDRTDDSNNNNNNLNSQVEFLSPLPPPPPPPPPSIIYNDSPQRSEYFLESSLYVTAGVENSASGNSDEADYDSACDELGDSQEDGASHTASDTPI
ncbi:RING finger protein 44-like [Vigna unguiculata]|uniref:RING-type E3 ubiquitin transferase n=1 Tax=Vigna unguiculata TaxID=3917 RepID=A0A4D6MFY7_VIGUN|nr:RING finger protein 44-like [Vigna unguiculata]QCE00343.1 E3 ubiquitin-protein ligase [Vigna unguiculata]